MGKNKLEKFADMASYPHVFEYPYSAIDNVPFDMKGKWHEEFFKNDHPIVLELGCGRGEYLSLIHIFLYVLRKEYGKERWKKLPEEIR